MTPALPSPHAPPPTAGTGRADAEPGLSAADLRRSVAPRIALGLVVALLGVTLGAMALSERFAARRLDALAATSVRLRDFVLAMVGMLPVIGAYAALGHAGTRGPNEQSLPPWLLVVGIGATVLLGVLLARITQNALRDADRGNAGA